MEADGLHFEPRPLGNERVDDRIVNSDVQLNPLLCIDGHPKVIAEILIVARPPFVEDLVAKVKVGLE